MIPPWLLLLVVGQEPTALPGITIDPCVQVDAEEVRRLASIELASWSGARSPAELEVAVSCRENLQEVRLVDRARDLVTVRSIDLGATELTDRDAKARELALAIAELLRRAATERPPEPVPVKPAPVAPPPVVRKPAAPTPPPRRWRGEIGLSGGIVGWTGGEVWFGADAAARAHLGRYLIGELQVGGRGTRSVGLNVGRIAASGVGGRLGLALDVTPGMRRVGLSFGASVGGDWLRYSAVDAEDVEYGGGDAGSLNAAGTTTAFVVLADPVCLTFRAAVGGALHAISIRNNGETVSGARGALVSGSVGVATQF